MNSLRTKITTLVVCIAVIAITIAAVIGTVSIKKLGDSSAEQLLLLLCETGEKNLDFYFESITQSVVTVSDLVKADLKSADLSELSGHIERVRDVFGKAAFQTHGVLTYYYRIDPSVSTEASGFWYADLDGNGFVEREPTDLTECNISDTSDPEMVWFTVPKLSGKSIWLPPYISKNLYRRVLSYNVPIYKGNAFVGVVGIEIDYSVMAMEVDSIKLYDNGYAFINDAEGNIIYHPLIDVTVLEEKPKVPDGLLGEDNNVRYTYEGVEKQGVWHELSNGMRLNVSVPVSEINSEWHHLILIMVIVSAALIVVIILLSLHFSGSITKHLRQLTEAAEQVDAGNYDVMLSYNEKDEVGILSRTFDKLIRHLKIHISDLTSLAKTDALTAVSNKGAYDLCIRELQQQLDDPDQFPEFAIAIFDCDDLKLINDRYGHDKGDLYLKNTSAIICHVFGHSPVFRIGGDEFAVIMQNEDYENRTALIQLFEKRCESTCVKDNEWWEQIRVSMGMAVYDPSDDRTVDDVSRRADKLMYENKHDRKVPRR